MKHSTMILALLSLCCVSSSLVADIVPTGRADFAPLQTVQGKPGRVVKLKAQLFEETFDTVTRRKSWRPLPAASISFFVDDRSTVGGYFKPVGGIATTDAAGSGGTKYRIPKRHPKPFRARYAVDYQGDAYHPRTAGDIGLLRVN